MYPIFSAKQALVEKWATFAKGKIPFKSMH